MVDEMVVDTENEEVVVGEFDGVVDVLCVRLLDAVTEGLSVVLAGTCTADEADAAAVIEVEMVGPGEDDTPLCTGDTDAMFDSAVSDGVSDCAEAVATEESDGVLVAVVVSVGPREGDDVEELELVPEPVTVDVDDSENLAERVDDEVEDVETVDVMLPVDVGEELLEGVDVADKLTVRVVDADIVLAVEDDEVGVDDAQPLKEGVLDIKEDGVGETVRVAIDESVAVPVPDAQKVLAADKDADMVTLAVALVDELPVNVRVVEAVLDGVPERDARPEAVDDEDAVVTILADTDRLDVGDMLPVIVAETLIDIETEVDAESQIVDDAVIEVEYE